MYTFTAALKSVFRNKFVNFTVIVSLALGLLFPMLVFSIGNVFLKEMKAGVTIHPERTAGISTGQEIRIDTEKALRDHPQIELITEGTYTQNDYIVSGNKIVKTQTVGYKAGIDKFTPFEMLDGKFYTDEELNGSDSICLISSQLQKELDCKAGDTVVLGKEEFTVNGVYIKKDKSVFLPLDTFSRKYEVFPAYEILFRKDCDVKTEGAEVLKSLAEEYGLDPENSCMLMSDYYEERNELKNFYISIAIMLAIASVTLIYAALNISNIMVNKINADRKSYSIKMQLGASKTNLFGFLWVQLLVLMLISVGIDAAVTVILEKTAPFFTMFSFKLDAAAVLLTLLIGAAYVMILSSKLVKKVYSERRAA